jgi:hypothetical protein
MKIWKLEKFHKDIIENFRLKNKQQNFIVVAIEYWLVIKVIYPYDKS